MLISYKICLLLTQKHEPNDLTSVENPDLFGLFRGGLDINKTKPKRYFQFLQHSS